MKIHRLSIVFFIVTLVMYVAGNVSLPITDPVESAYALTAKEMVISGDWLSPQIFHQYWYDKPALIYWLIALSYKLFGISDFAARLPSGLLGALSVAWMYQLVRSISGRRLLAIWSAIVLGTSLEFWILAHGIVTDMALLLASVGTFGYGRTYQVDCHCLSLCRYRRVGQGTGGHRIAGAVVPCLCRCDAVVAHGAITVSVARDSGLLVGGRALVRLYVPYTRASICRRLFRFA
ncbi:glycosyltransferase family 39 protein [uncultured Veillonella sp.]|uniref:ArnT family glycosyltransferase n=1 Tax=uncultured Veillonella sp. TaxID=159268 RepID=UPI00258C659E|nr:glycosyltransferase family 39 protein [uncultured Veillonella sp.]